MTTTSSTQATLRTAAHGGTPLASFNPGLALSPQAVALGLRTIEISPGRLLYIHDAPKMTCVYVDVEVLK